MDNSIESISVNVHEQHEPPLIGKPKLELVKNYLSQMGQGYYAMAAGVRHTAMTIFCTGHDEIAK